MVVLTDFLLSSLVDMSQHDTSDISGNNATVINDFAGTFDPRPACHSTNQLNLNLSVQYSEKHTTRIQDPGISFSFLQAVCLAMTLDFSQAVCYPSSRPIKFTGTIEINPLSCLFNPSLSM